MGNFRIKTKEPHILAITILCVFAAMGSVIITPALPQISRFFSVTESHTKLTVSLFLLGYALGQLIYGPLRQPFWPNKNSTRRA